MEDSICRYMGFTAHELSLLTAMAYLLMGPYLPMKDRMTVVLAESCAG